MLDYGLFSYASKQEVLDKSIRYWNPGQDPVLARHRRRSGDGRPRGLRHPRRRRPPADRPAHQRRHLQPRPSQSRADRDAAHRARLLRHRQPLVPLGRPHGAGRGAGRGVAGHELCGLRPRRRRGGGRGAEVGALRDPAPQDRLDRQGLPRPCRPFGGHRRRALLEDLPVRSAGRVLPGAVQRSRRHGGGAEGSRRGGGDPRDDPGDLRLPDAGARVSAGGQGALREVRHALHRRRGADRLHALRRDVGLAGVRGAARPLRRRQGAVGRPLPDRGLHARRARRRAG